MYKRQGLVGYFNERYGPEEIVIACAGKIDPERFVALCEQHFGGYKAAPTAVKDKVPPATGDSSEGRYNGRVKDIEQLHFCLALPGVDSESEDLYTCLLYTSSRFRRAPRRFSLLTWIAAWRKMSSA